MTRQGAEVSNDRNLHAWSNKRHWIWPATATPDEQLWLVGLGEEGGSDMLVGDEAGRGDELLNPRSEHHSDMERALGHLIKPETTLSLFGSEKVLGSV